MSSRRILVPAAGFGQRVGAPQSKEMLLRPSGRLLDRQPLVDLPIHLAREFHAEPHVVLRSEKKNLVEYLQQKGVPFQSVKPTKEWPHSLLLSEPYWREFNVVCLPDMDFSPWMIIEQMFGLLESNSTDLVFGVFSVADLRSWGAIRCVDEAQHYEHCEKPEFGKPGAYAWGLFGFRREFGRLLLESLLESTLDHQWRPIRGRCHHLHLESFEDLTRGDLNLGNFETAK